MGFLMVVGNGLGIAEGGDFLHSSSIEERILKFTKKLDTKHKTRSLAKPMLQAGVLSVRL